MTTFIDFRYSRALAAALFAGQEKEEAEISFVERTDNYVALDPGLAGSDRLIATLVDRTGDAAATMSRQSDDIVFSGDGVSGGSIRVACGEGRSRLVALRLSDGLVGVRCANERTESDSRLLQHDGLRLACGEGVTVLGQGTGRVSRWAELFYHRETPKGLCVEITMDWHHLRAGIPLFSTMTAEELVAAGKFRLRFRSYAYEASEAEVTDFVRLFGCDDLPDVAMHLTPALYDPRTPGIPNLGFGVIETDNVHPHLVERCNRMDRVCVPSTFTRDTFARNGVNRPIDVISHGVDPEYFRPPPARTSLPGGKGFNFLAVGTHVERKNIRHLVRAFLEEFREAEDVALFLLLRPEYHTTQNNVALEFTEWERDWARDSANIFLWTGYLTREHLRDFYAGADAYVMPSNEGFGLTLLEAMSCGTPAIGLDHGGVVDFVNERNGKLVPKGRAYLAEDIDTLPYIGDVFHEPDIGELRRAMRGIFEHPAETRRLGAQARVDAERLTWKAVTADLAASIERTHSDFHSRRSSATDSSAAAAAAPRLTVVLRVLDDADAGDSLDYLKTLRGVRVLCLFTRYARIRDVTRARKYGFVYYRWDGTVENAKIIARSIMGRSWIALIDTGERITGDLTSLIGFLDAQSRDVTDVAIAGPDGSDETRIFHVRPQGESSGKTRYSGVSVCRSPS